MPRVPNANVTFWLSTNYHKEHAFSLYGLSQLGSMKDDTLLADCLEQAGCLQL